MTALGAGQGQEIISDAAMFGYGVTVSPEGPCVGSLVLSVEALGGSRTFKRWDQMGSHNWPLFFLWFPVLPCDLCLSHCEVIHCEVLTRTEPMPAPLSSQTSRSVSK
jgi:hypothetical protein